MRMFSIQIRKWIGSVKTRRKKSAVICYQWKSNRDRNHVRFVVIIVDQYAITRFQFRQQNLRHLFNVDWELHKWRNRSEFVFEGAGVLAETDDECKVDGQHGRQSR